MVESFPLTPLNIHYHGPRFFPLSPLGGEGAHVPFCAGRGEGDFRSGEGDRP